MEDLLEEMGVKKSLECEVCLEEGSREAEFFCKNCNCSYCQECFDQYHRRGIFKTHEKTSLNERRMELINYCKRHTLKRRSHICERCRSPVCDECMAEEIHKGHRFFTMNDREVSALTSKISSKEIETVMEKARNLDIFFEEEKTFLEKKFELFINHLLSLKRDVLDQLNEQKAGNSDVLEFLKILLKVDLNENARESFMGKVMGLFISKYNFKLESIENSFKNYEIRLEQYRVEMAQNFSRKSLTEGFTTFFTFDPLSFAEGAFLLDEFHRKISYSGPKMVCNSVMLRPCIHQDAKIVFRINKSVKNHIFIGISSADMQGNSKLYKREIGECFFYGKAPGYFFKKSVKSVHNEGFVENDVIKIQVNKGAKSVCFYKNGKLTKLFTNMDFPSNMAFFVELFDQKDEIEILAFE